MIVPTGLDDCCLPNGFTNLAMTELEISSAEFAALRRDGGAYRLLDVREPWEVKIAKIEGSDDIPMRGIPASLHELERDSRPLVVMCHHGVRSLQVVCWLRGQGVEGCRSLAGGIEEWSRDVDPEIPRY